MSIRTVRTTWTEYSPCDTEQRYRFRVLVEVEGLDDWDAEDLTHSQIQELLATTSRAWGNKLDDEEEEDEVGTY
jgi:hypothetical protein